ncbi:1-acyldihydroxyacetone-phosphate reductase [Fusarium tjaetaba]|uniref:1-acyldihydroxyacetone-phosphate reductase n=1 Tax=Fusarium tjaetaba TaxID=1567544 RepID=A0A8H5S2F4_9HYPO|nr:1-acyldihydroxyacetone-phosphate reductase [Fusarium tjaetaba]KAF5643380.1 1-acyldihydroxyacetone-phosphate reductase [Fusarium tjaetaba]
MTASYQPPFALVTGCNSGIGEQLAITLAKNNYTVLATARRVESLDNLTRQHANIIALPLELGDSTSIERLRDSVIKYTKGRLDILINNAGMHYAAPATDIDVNQVTKLFSVNVVAVMHMCQLFIPLLQKAPRPRIVQIGSVTRDVPVVCQSVYNASKAALSQYTKTLRVELRPLSIEVIEVVTGYVRSNILRDGVLISDDSLYRPIKSTVESVKNGGNKNGMLADEYARVVVRQILGNKYKREIWEGHRARILRLMVTFFPPWIHDVIMATAQALLQQKLTITPKTASLLIQAGYSDYRELKYATPNSIVEQFTSKFGIPKTSASAFRRACRRLVFLGTQDDPEEQDKICADWTNKALAARGIWRADFDDLTGEQIAELLMGTA